MTRTKKATYELTFFGSATAAYFPKRYKRNHTDAASIRATIARVFGQLASKGLPTACHSPVIYDAAGNQISLPHAS